MAAIAACGALSNRGIPNSSPDIAYYNSVADLSPVVSNDSHPSTNLFALPVSVQSTADFGDVPIPKGYEAALKSANAPEWQAAIAKELKGLLDLGVWELIPRSSLPKGANVMRNHWVFAVKRNADGTIAKFKARMVADGNTQVRNVDFQRIFSTVIKTTTLRLVLAIACSCDYNLTQIDICQAYLQAELSADLYMMVPQGIPKFDKEGNPLVCKLRKSLYGLKQAGREWHQLFVTFLIEWGFTQSPIDVCLLTFRKGAKLLWALIYVDDVVLVDNDQTLRTSFVTALGERFPLDDRGNLEWMLGIAVARNRESRTLSLSQKLYVQDIATRFVDLVDSSHVKSYASPMDPNADLTPNQCPAANSIEYKRMAPRRPIYYSLVGAILWLSNMTRPDVTFAISQLARFVHNPAIEHFNALVRVLIYLVATADRVLLMSPTAAKPLLGLVDAAWTTTYSESGALFYFRGCLFAWFAKVQRSISLSSAEAEWFAAMLAVRDLLFHRDLLTELGFLDPGPTELLTDSKSVVDLAYDPVAFKKTKHIARAGAFVRDMVTKRYVSFRHIPGTENTADVLTKAQTRPVFTSLVDKLFNGTYPDTAIAGV